MRFQEGDIVKLSRKSEYYDENHPSNPRDIKGEITETYCGDADGFCIRVKWSNGNRNTYKECDLGLVTRSKGE